MAEHAPMDDQVDSLDDQHGEDALVESGPDDQATPQGSGRGRICVVCGQRGFRRSRLRVLDALHIAALLFPVRCTSCGKRQHVSIPTALSALPKRRRARA